MYKNLLTIFVFISVSVLSFGKSNDKNKDKTKCDIVATAQKEALNYYAKGKTKKAINILEESIYNAKTCGDDEAYQGSLNLLIQYHTELGNSSEATKYQVLLDALNVAEENKLLEEANQEKENKIANIKQKQQLSEAEKLATQRELEDQTMALLQTKDSLGLLEILNKQRNSEIELLNKDKEIQDQLLKNKELALKEKEANERLTYIIIVSLILGLLTLTILAFYIYKNFKQKKTYSEQIETQLDTIHKQHLDITNSINYAERIQRAMLPNEQNLNSLVKDSFILFKPKEKVSGDFYWFYNISTHHSLNEFDPEATEQFDNIPENTDKVLIAAVDCTGHGVPGSMMSMIGYNLLNTIANKNFFKPCEILGELNRGIRFALQQYKNDNKDGMDMAMCLIDKTNNKIIFSGAKNPMVIIQNGEINQIKGSKDSIGGSQGKSQRIYESNEFDITPETYIYLFSDGYQDQFGGPDGKKFMIKNLRELFYKIHKLPMDQQKQILEDTLKKWIGKNEKQIDDILIIGFKVA